MLIHNLKESQIQADILTSFKKLHVGFFWRNNNVGVFDKEKMTYRKPSKIFSMKGISDILGCYQGRFCAIEVKTEREYKWAFNLYEEIRKTSNIFLYTPKSDKEEHVYNQILFIEQLKQFGGIGFFTYSLDHALRNLQKYSRG